jgi:PEP-CTERM motif
VYEINLARKKVGGLKMKRFCVALGVLSLAVCFSAGSASAAFKAGELVNGDIVRMSTAPPGGNGEFNVVEYDGYGGSAVAGGHNFRTFCVEKHESFGGGFPGEFEVTLSSFSDTAAGHGGPKNLAVETAALFKQFGLGLLGGVVGGVRDFFGDSTAKYDYADATQRNKDANMLQNAIWFFQQQQTLAEAGGASNKYITAVNAAKTGSGPFFGLDIGGVQIMNLRYTEGSANDRVQDQLYYGGGDDVHVPVPEPGSLALFALGMVGVGFAQRRRKMALVA